MNDKTQRDIAIEAAYYALIRTTNPFATNFEIQTGLNLEVGTGYYAVFFNGRKVCTVNIHTNERFSLIVETE